VAVPGLCWLLRLFKGFCNDFRAVFAKHRHLPEIRMDEQSQHSWFGRNLAIHTIMPINLIVLALLALSLAALGTVCRIRDRMATTGSISLYVYMDSPPFQVQGSTQG
jgi:hypothetical protein